jgi:initiation factor 1A
MPKKVKAGKNNKSKNDFKEKRKLIEADLDGQVYGIIQKALGNRFFEVNCLDSKIRRCKARSKRLKINTQECVIISLRDFDNNSGDIIYKYEPDEVRQLQRQGLLPSNESMGNIRETSLDTLNQEENDVGFDFSEI